MYVSCCVELVTTVVNLFSWIQPTANRAPVPKRGHKSAYAGKALEEKREKKLGESEHKESEDGKKVEETEEEREERERKERADKAKRIATTAGVGVGGLAMGSLAAAVAQKST